MFAGLKLEALGSNAALVVYIMLPAVARLVGVGETRITGCSAEVVLEVFVDLTLKFEVLWGLGGWGLGSVEGI